jgi:glycosyltransferase involved in cell wall biosynthesis
VELIIAGGAGYPFRETLPASLPDTVRLLGAVDDADLPSLYSGALAFTYPSIYEGFGLPPLEAMACGTPVMASTAASLPEVVGNAGLLVDPHNLEEIAAALRRVIMDADLRRELRQAGMQRARQFSWEKTAQQVWEVLQTAAPL